MPILARETLRDDGNGMLFDVSVQVMSRPRSALCPIVQKIRRDEFEASIGGSFASRY